MTRRMVDIDDRQYGSRTSAEVRTPLLELVYQFVENVRGLRGVRRVALLGSILTLKPRPKDVDVLVTIAGSTDLSQLARFGRRLKGTAQAKVNSGADVFLASDEHRYLGRVCHYRECHSRALCRAQHCGLVQHLCDDLDVVALGSDLIGRPPLELAPAITARVDVPPDVESFLLSRLRLTDGGAAPVVLLCLHQWGAHEHPSLMSADHALPRNGLLLFFRVDDFDMALPRARALVTRLEREPHTNPNTSTAEFSLRDPDGYHVTISALSAAV